LFLHLIEHSSNPIMTKKNCSGANDVMSMFVHVLSFECCALLQTFECRGSLLWTVADTEVVYLKFKVSVNGCYRHIAKPISIGLQTSF